MRRRSRLITIGVAAAVLTIAMTATAPGVSIRKLVKKEVAKQIANATGPAGATGTAGAAGATNVTVRLAILNVNAASSNSVTVPCVGDEVAVGGGMEVGSGETYTGDTQFGSRPNPTSGTPTGWTVSWVNVHASEHDEHNAYVICAAP